MELYEFILVIPNTFISHDEQYLESTLFYLSMKAPLNTKNPIVKNTGGRGRFGLRFAGANRYLHKLGTELQLSSSHADNTEAHDSGGGQLPNNNSLQGPSCTNYC